MSEYQRRFGRHPAVLGVDSRTSFVPSEFVADDFDSMPYLVAVGKVRPRLM
jgi:hypothetical protein